MRPLGVGKHKMGTIGVVEIGSSMNRTAMVYTMPMKDMRGMGGMIGV